MWYMWLYKLSNCTTKLIMTTSSPQPHTSPPRCCSPEAATSILVADDMSCWKVFLNSWSSSFDLKTYALLGYFLVSFDNFLFIFLSYLLLEFLLVGSNFLSYLPSLLSIFLAVSSTLCYSPSIVSFPSALILVNSQHFFSFSEHSLFNVLLFLFCGFSIVSYLLIIVVCLFVCLL